VALAALAWAAVRFRRSVPAVTWGALVLALAWIPVSNAFFTIHTVFGERVLYLPSVGFCVLAGAAAARAVRARAQWTRVAAWTALALLLLFNAVRTGVRNRDWRNDLALFDATSRVSTRSVRVLNNYGNVLYTRGDLEGAARQYRKALSYFPDYDDARINLASVLIAQGRHDEAREHLEQVLARNPDHPIANDNLRLVVPQTDTDP
jgi:tetratricopeptide (TPR) repeat protein